VREPGNAGLAFGGVALGTPEDSGSNQVRERTEEEESQRTQARQHSNEAGTAGQAGLKGHPPASEYKAGREQKGGRDED